MRGAHRVASHFLQHAETEPLKPVGQGRAHSRVVLVVAGALDLQGFAVEQESLVGIEDRRAHAKAYPLRVARMAARFHGHNRRIEIRRIHRPKFWIRQLCRGRKACRSVHRDGLRRRLGGSHGLASRVQNLPAHLGALRLLALVLNHGTK